ncbi:MAG: hypothetical protein AAFV93_12955 [Chloroflexota bacterium]
MVDYTLQHLIYGQAIVGDTPSDVPDLLAISDNFTVTNVSQLIGRVPLSPLPLDSVQSSQAIAFIQETIQDKPYTILARAHYQRATQTLPARQLVFIPRDDVAQIQNFDTLIGLFEQAIPQYNITNSPIAPLVVSQNDVPSKDKQVTVIKTLMEAHFSDQFQRLLCLLDKVITQKNIIIRNFIMDGTTRLSLVQGLRLLLPVPVRHLLTFTTHTHALSQTLPRLSFNDAVGETVATIIDWQTFTDVDMTLTHPYVLQLQEQWDDKVIDLVDLIERYSEIASHLTSNEMTLSGILTTTADRHALDRSAMKGISIASEQILGILESDIPMSMALQTAYVILLLENNFDNRDTTMAQTIASILEENDDLDQSIQPFLNSSIEVQPDAVYNFLRTHLHSIEQDTISERWLNRLHEATKMAMTVAIESGDVATIRSWLTLISREPLHYQLSDIVGDAIQDVKHLASDDAELAQELLVVAVRRQPEMIADLLADESMNEGLPDSIRDALLQHDMTAIEDLGSESRDLFLLSLGRAIDADQAVVTSQTVRTLWQYYLQQANTLSIAYRPSTLIKRLFDTPQCFVNGAYSTLLSSSLADGMHDALFYDAVSKLNTQSDIAEAIAQALEQSDRVSDKVIDVVSTMLGQEAITPQLAVDVMTTLLGNRNWDTESLPYVEHLARLMSQHPDTNTNTGVLWKVSELSAEHRNEQMLKVSQRRLLEATSKLVSESQIVESIKNIRRDAQWSTTGKTTLIRWWRAFTHERGTGQLQKIEKFLDGNRALDDLRAIVQTTVAMRRVIGTRTLSEFSEIVASTYGLLQALSEGFDPSDKLVDSMTIRNELEARAEELPSEQRPVLSTNLRELAQLVSVLHENRSKPSLIRNDDALERQLTTGEQEPQSALDVMRWLSGYLDGIQKDQDE